MTARGAIACAVTLLAAAWVPAAQGATKEVAAGPSSAALRALGPKGFPADAEFDLFARRTITIHAGDRVRWRINGSHTVTFLNRHRRPGQLIADLKVRVSGVDDAAGIPFWFNGKPTVLSNPDVLLSRGGGAFERTRVLSSGLALGSTRSRGYTLRFPKPGRFSYVCLLHPDMTGTVVVERRRARIPSRGDDRKQAAKELEAVVRAATVKEGAAVVSPVAGGTSVIQAGNDGANFALRKFFPSEASVPVGVAITLRVSPHSDADHTFTFGPADLVKGLSDRLVTRKSSRRYEQLPQAIWASDATLPPLTPTVHGNGFLNTGILDTGALGDSPLPLLSNASVTFTVPGTYALVCLLHPGMQATVEVVG